MCNMSNLLLALKANLLSASWSIDSFLTNSKTAVVKYGGMFLLVLGAAILIYGGYKLFRAVTGRTGSTGPEWGKVILSIVIGGVLFISGTHIMEDVGHAGDTLVNQLGNSISPTVQVEHMSNTLSHFVK